MNDEIDIENSNFVSRDKIIYGDEVYGDKVAGDKVVYQGPTYPRLNYRSDIADLLTFYTQTFIGCEQEWNQLLRFTAQETPGYFLIEALPGYGKSALMAQLVHRQETNQWGETPRPELIYFFIRQEGQRHTPVAFLQAVNSQLLTLLKFPGGVPPDLITLRTQFSDLWSQVLVKATSSKPLLLLVDGLDEAETGEVTIAHLLPTNLTSYVHVVVSSRSNLTPLEQVPLEHPLKQTQTISLDAFDMDKLAILLQQYGSTSDVARDLSPRVLAMTKGEPLFARFVCQELVTEGEIALVRLEQNPPAHVEAYFRQQLEQLKTVAKSRLSRDILGLLLATLGGITIEEIAEVLDVSKWDVDDAIEPIQRFLLGETKLELMHLQLRKVVAQQFGQQEQKKYQQRLLVWCQSYENQNWPAETPDYILAHYARHLTETGRRETLYTLISHHWMNLKFGRIYSYRTFTEDVNLAIEVAKAEEPINWVQWIRCCLIYASLTSLASRVSPGALGVLAYTGHVAQALSYALLMVYPGEQGRAYSRISEAVLEQGDLEQAKAVLDQALATIETLAGEYKRAKALREVVQAVARVGDRVRLNQTLAMAQAMKYDIHKAEALSGVVLALADVGEFEQAIETTATIGDELYRVEALSGVVRVLAQTGKRDESTRLAKQALAAVEAIDNGLSRMEALSLAIEALAWTGELEQAMAMTETIDSNFHRTAALSGIAHVMSQVGEKETATHIANRALAMARAISDEEDQAQALEWAIQALALVGESDQALAVVEAIENRQHRVWMLGEVAWVLAQAGDTEKALLIANQALIAHPIHKEWHTVQVLGKVAHALTQVEKTEMAKTIISQLSTMAMAISDEQDRARALHQVAYTLAQAGNFNEALEVAGAIVRKYRKAEAFIDVAQSLTKAGYLDRALTVISTIEGEDRIVKALYLVARTLAQEEKRDKITIFAEQSLMTAEKIEDEHSKVRALSRAACILAQAKEQDRAVEVFSRALEMANAIQHGWHRTEVLGLILETLVWAGDFDQASRVAKMIENEEYRDWVLERFAITLAEIGEFNWALVVAEAIKNEEYTVRAFNKMARSLAQAGESDRALNLAMERSGGGWNKAEALSGVACALSQTGETSRAQEVLQLAFTTARIAGRSSVLKVLGNGALTLAALDQGKTLSQAYKAVMEVENWWGTERIHTHEVG